MFEKHDIRNVIKRPNLTEVPEFHAANTQELPENILSDIKLNNEGEVFESRVSVAPGRLKMYILMTREGNETVSNVISNVHICDYSGEEFAGHTKVGIAEYGTEEKKRMAYVRDTVTMDTDRGSDFKGRGLGTRRLLVANKYCLEKFGVPLSSGTIVDESAQRLWERLVKEGIAEKVSERSMGAFRFKI